MKKILSPKYHHVMDSIRPAARGFVVIFFFLLLLILGSCGGDSGGGDDTGNPTPNPTPTDSPSVTDTSGDLYITVRAYSSSQIYVSWEAPFGEYWSCGDSYATIYRDGAEIVHQCTDLYNNYYNYYIDTDIGLRGETTYCYGVEVTEYCFGFFPPVTVSSGTACIATPPDTTAPLVTSTSPSNGATNVPIYANIAVTFSEAVDPFTINTSSFLVSGPSGAVPVSLTVNSATATFTAGVFLTYASTYTATITTEVRDMAGNPMANAFSWSFSTPSGPLTQDATNVRDVSATLNGRFENAAGDTTAVWFEYGTSTAYGNSTTPAYFATAGSTPFSFDIFGLSDWTTYHYRMVVQNTAGTYYGNDKSFKTYIAPEILSSGLNAPLDIHLDSGSVYWVDPCGDAVKSVPVNGGTTAVVATSEMGGDYMASLAIDATHIYWADWSTIWKKERSGGTVTTLVSGRSGLGSLHVYSTELYFRSDNGIEKIDLNTGTITIAAPGGPLAIQGGLAVDSSNIYWTGGDTIAKTARMGGPVVTLAVGLIGAHGLFLDSGYLYWAESNAIKKMSVSGGPITTIAANITPCAIAKDDTHVYWTDYYGATINKVDIASGAVVTLAVGQSLSYLRGPGDIAVDATGVYWIMDGDSCYPPLGEIRKAPKTY